MRARHGSSAAGRSMPELATAGQCAAYDVWTLELAAYWGAGGKTSTCSCFVLVAVPNDPGEQLRQR